MTTPAEEDKEIKETLEILERLKSHVDQILPVVRSGKLKLSFAQSKGHRDFVLGDFHITDLSQ